MFTTSQKSEKERFCSDAMFGCVLLKKKTGHFQELLWLLYDMGHIEKYPMAIGNLGDLEEISPTPGRPSSLVLFNKAINSARVHYKNMHVYPYTYLGGYHFRHRHFKEAIAAWSEAACVIRK